MFKTVTGSETRTLIFRTKSQVHKIEYKKAPPPFSVAEIGL